MARLSSTFTKCKDCGKFVFEDETGIHYCNCDGFRFKPARVTYEPVDEELRALDRTAEAEARADQ